MKHSLISQEESNSPISGLPHTPSSLPSASYFVLLPQLAVYAPGSSTRFPVTRSFPTRSATTASQVFSTGPESVDMHVKGQMKGKAGSWRRWPDNGQEEPMCHPDFHQHVQHVGAEGMLVPWRTNHQVDTSCNESWFQSTHAERACPPQ